MKNQKLTKTLVDKISLEQSGQKLYWDSELQGFGLRVGVTKKTYIVQGNVNGKDQRYTIGAHGTYTPETARQAARELLLKMSKGISLIDEKKAKRVKKCTLKEVYDRYISERSGSLTERTIANYDGYIRNHISKWSSTSLENISRDDIIGHYEHMRKLGKDALARQVFKFLQTLYSYAQIDNEDLKNPVEILSKKKMWIAKKRRETYIKNYQLPKWYQSVMKLNNHSIRDALLVILFTGMRKNEVFTMKWSYVDFEDKTLKIPFTKNKKPLVLPLNSYLYNIFSERKKYAGESEWIFPGNGKSGHITEAKKAVKAIVSDSNIDFMIHDLRRTFATITSSMDVSAYNVKRLVNHSMAADVTAGYIINNVDNLRDVSERIGEKISGLIKG